jgi:hypothetical protein
MKYTPGFKSAKFNIGVSPVRMPFRRALPSILKREYATWCKDPFDAVSTTEDTTGCGFVFMFTFASFPEGSSTINGSPEFHGVPRPLD